MSNDNLKTIQVTLKASPETGAITINEMDFDPSVHAKITRERTSLSSDKSSNKKDGGKPRESEE